LYWRGATTHPPPLSSVAAGLQFLTLCESLLFLHADGLQFLTICEGLLFLHADGLQFLTICEGGTRSAAIRNSQITIRNRKSQIANKKSCPGSFFLNSRLFSLHQFLHRFGEEEHDEPEQQGTHPRNQVDIYIQ